MEPCECTKGQVRRSKPALARRGNVATAHYPAAMRRVIGGVGKVFVTAGVLILLFVAYQLWGTGVIEARAQDDLRRDFEREVAAGEPRTSATSGETGGTDGTDGTGATTTSTTTTTTTAPPLGEAVPIPPQGEPVAIVRIPKIGVDKVVVEGTTVADLRKGPGHYVGMPLPGQLGNAGIAGHRTTYGAPFADLDQLTIGDEIEVETLAGVFRYRVTEEPFAVKPNQTEVLNQPDPNQGDQPVATLTLTTCNPKYSAAERLIVKAEYDGPLQLPAPPPEVRQVVSIDAGLSGEKSSRMPTILWGAIVAVVGLLWWLVFHRYPRWTTWLAGVVPFLVVLAIFFFFLERILPSNY
jgi:sortase A